MPEKALARRLIRIAPYDADWPRQFAEVGGALQRALGASALRIDHLGSTSVPRLAAKDVSDIQLTVAALEPAVREALKAIGYVRRPHLADHIPAGPDDSPDDWARWVFKEPPGRRATNMHVRVAGRPNQRLPLLFRDFLRPNGAVREAYERVKLPLARRHPEDVDAYSAAKDPV